MARPQHSKNDDCKPRQKKCDRRNGHGHGNGGGKKDKCRSNNKPWRPPTHQGNGHGRNCD